MGSTDRRVALVTGGAQGIGRAIALTLAKAGADVAVVDVNPDGVAAAVADLEAIGRGAFGITGDVSSLDFAQEAVEKTVKAAGGLHIGRPPRLRSQGPEEGCRVEGAGAHLEVVGLLDHASLRGPVALEGKDQFLKGHNSSCLAQSRYFLILRLIFRSAS